MRFGGFLDEAGYSYYYVNCADFQLIFETKLFKKSVLTKQSSKIKNSK